MWNKKQPTVADFYGKRRLPRYRVDSLTFQRFHEVQKVTSVDKHENSRLSIPHEGAVYVL